MQMTPPMPRLIRLEHKDNIKRLQGLPDQAAAPCGRLAGALRAPCGRLLGTGAFFWAPV